MNKINTDPMDYMFTSTIVITKVCYVDPLDAPEFEHAWADDATINGFAASFEELEFINKHMFDLVRKAAADYIRFY